MSARHGGEYTKRSCEEAFGAGRFPYPGEQGQCEDDEGKVLKRAKESGPVRHGFSE